MYNYNYGYNNYQSTANTLEGMGTWVIISLILAIVGCILVYVLFLNSKEEYPSKFVNWLKSFLNFEKLAIEVIIKVTYLFFAIFITLASFALIPVNFASFLMTLIFGNIGIRVVYELVIVNIMIWKNTTEIKKEVTKKNK